MTCSKFKNYTPEKLVSGTTKVILFDFDPDQVTLGHYKNILSSDEIARLQAIKAEHKQKEFIITRALTRQFIIDSTDLTDKEIKIKIANRGKPYCDHPKASLYFNISHSKDYGVIALNLNHELGIDIQHHREQRNPLKLAERFFCNSEKELIKSINTNQSEAELYQCFYNIWVRKEALLKGTGSGLAYGLSQYPVIDATKQSQASFTIQIDKSQYYIEDLPAPEQYAIALATESHNDPFQLLAWQHS